MDSILNSSVQAYADDNPRFECAVIIVAYHPGPILFDCLTAALDQDGLDRIVLVENGLDAEMCERVDALAAETDRLQILRGHGNVGFAKGCNLGAAAATGSHVLLLNPDCVLQPGVLRRCLEVFADKPGASLVTARITNPDGSEQAHNRRRLITPWNSVVEGLKLYRLFPGTRLTRRVLLLDQEMPTEVTPVDCVSGAFMMLPRPLYHAMGRLDERFFLHFEDVDLCARIQKDGGTILYVPDAIAMHVASTSDTPALFVEWHKAIGALRYFKKHFTDTLSTVTRPLVALLVMLRFLARAAAIVPFGFTRSLRQIRR
jgi:GT2 family glycosyltransferase